ncbi:hypothetical protein [Fulvivirga imtechensis]|uniref:hypothetical protein n=1 Tax=Fulvivirga imtechensis TaxID=881893 RepID=UPI00058DF2D9|nr:hypothetical protein [Fulvivirga imtechensis]
MKKLEKNQLNSTKGGIDLGQAYCGGSLAGTLSGTEPGSVERVILTELFLQANPYCAQYF